MGLGGVLYSLSRLSKSDNIKIFAMFWLASTFMAFIFTLPQLIPTYKLYKNSFRDSSLDYKQGSFNTVMLSNLFLPLQYGNHQNYEGLKIFEEGYSYTEIYIYLGIAASILFLYSFVFGNDRSDWFDFALVYTALILISARYIPYGDKIPLLVIFRHWNRAVLLAYFGIALAVGKLFRENKGNPRKLNYKRLVLLALFSAPFLIQMFLHSRDGGYFYSQSIKHLNTSWDVHLIWFATAIATILTLVASSLLPKTKILTVVVVFVIIDTFYYIQDPLQYRINKVEDPSTVVFKEGLTGKKVIDFESGMRGLQYLNANYNSPFGYSQLVSKDYKLMLADYNFGTQLPKPSNMDDIDEKLIEMLDLEYIVEEDGTITSSEEFIQSLKVSP